MRKKLGLLLLAILTSIVMSACANMDPVSRGLEIRVGLNILVLEDMQKQGMIPQEFKDSVVAAMKIKQAELVKKFNSNMTQANIRRELEPYMSWAIKGEATNGSSNYATDITNLIDFIKEDSNYTAGGTFTGKTYTPTKAYDILGIDQDAEEFRKVLSSEIYKLRVIGDNTVSIWDVHKLASEFEASRASESDMADYFGKSGELLNDAKDILVTSSLGGWSDYTASPVKEEVEIPLTAAQEAMNPKPTPAVEIKETSVIIQAPAKENKIGSDFSILGDQEIPQISLRIQELNPEITSKVLASSTYREGSYIQTGYNIYDMVYPVYYIAGFKLDENDSNRFEAILAESKLQINIKTGRLFKSDNTPIEQRISNILDIKSDGTVDKTAFMLAEDKVVLRDYLEVTYMPGVVDGESWVALGRRIRLDKLKGILRNSIGGYLNQDGSSSANTTPLYVTDLMSFESRDANNSNKIYKLGTFTASSNYDTNTGEQVETLSKDIINTTIGLGSPKLATTDMGANTVTAGRLDMYGMCVGTNPFTTELYSSWIKGEDTSLGNLSWWVSWLTANKFDYGNRINAESLTNYLVENYSFEMRGQGYIIINPVTIGKIQDIYNDRSERDDMRGIRTWFIVIGFAMIAYSMLLITSWVIDTNIMGNINMMGVLTMNRWEAIHNEEDIPSSYNQNDKHYITFSKVLTGSLVIMGIGLILIFVDSAAIISKMISIFGGLSDVLYRVIK